MELNLYRSWLESLSVFINSVFVASGTGRAIQWKNTSLLADVV